MIKIPTYRSYGQEPFKAAVVHGGPGAPGSAGGMAQALSDTVGVLEPLQSADSVDGQVEELAQTLVDHADPPVVLVGHSWGAWLVLLTATRHPELVRKLVLVAGGPFEDRYVETMKQRRMERVPEPHRERAQDLLHGLSRPGGLTDEELSDLDQMLRGTDDYDRLDAPSDPPDFGFQPELHARIWAEAKELRTSGELLRQAGLVKCPVVAVHGDHDPHPAEGIRDPLGKVVSNLRFVLFEKCGHEPWHERHAREPFLDLMRRECSALNRRGIPRSKTG